MTAPNIRTITSSLKSLGYNDKVLNKEPFFSIEGKHIIFYISKIKSATDTRRKFLSDLSISLNKKKMLNSYDTKPSTSPKSSIGKIAFVDGSNFIVCKYYESSTKIDTNIQLKPSNITPPIVGNWITPEVIVKRVKDYVKKSNAPKPLADQINLLLKNSLSNKRSFTFEGEVSEISVPAEFFEILTAIKMAVLLRNNDNELKTILGFTNNKKKINYTFSKTSPLKINIPTKSNFPLTDYEISFLPNNYSETLKVSVKSKIKSDLTNTLKLDQIFDNVYDVGRWFRSLNSSIKKENFAQAQIAFAHLRFSTQSKKPAGSMVTKKNSPTPKYAGKVKTGFPIDAVGHILQIKYLNLDNVIKVRSWISEGKQKRKPTAEEVKMFAIACRKIIRVIANADIRNTLDTIFNSSKKSEQKILSVVNNLITSNNKTKTGEAVKPDLINLGKYCEKILEWASIQSSTTRIYNFYRMFHTKVLEERAICYAITDSKRIKSGDNVKTEIIFKYETMINWEKEWIGLRKKDNDALGLDL